MSSKQNTTIGGTQLTLGSNFGTNEFNIIGTNGRQIKINGIVPSGGGGVIPPIGDIDFIGNLNCNDQPGGGAKGIITAQKKINSGTGGIESVGDIKTLAAGDLKSGRDVYFNGQDIYKTYEGIEPQPPNLTYKQYRKLVATDDNSIFTGTNKFRNNAVSVQALNTDVPAVFVDKITLNTDGNINCNEINNNTLLKSTSIVCENGAPESQKVMARQYHFRPNSLETTGWVFSQKPPDAGGGSPEDNYLMLQNTQTTGSLNLVKSTFDPNNPTPFDIILDPQNGQVKTTTSFDAPQVNFRKNATDNWSIYQPPAGDPAEGTLIARSPNTLGSFNIFDSAFSSWAQFSSLATTLPKPTTINNTLNVNGNATLGNTNSLLFGGYAFRPQQFYKDIIGFSFNHLVIGPTNLLFNTGNPAVAEWFNVNTGASNQPIDLINNPGSYKITIRQTSNGTLNEINGMLIMSDIVLSRPNDNAPNVELANPTAYSYELYNAGSGGLTPGAPIITMIPGGLTWAVHCTFPQTSNDETGNIRITLTKMDFFA